MQNKADVLLGLQWGDEGKGKIVDVLTPKYDMIARFQGGPNAGHTLEFDNFKHVLHSIPSGIFHADKVNIIGGGVVLDPVIFKVEIDKLNKKGFDISNTLEISEKAHLIIPTHKTLDGAQELLKGEGKIGTTKKGIGPTYTDKISRNGLRIGDLLSSDFEKRYNDLKSRHITILESYGASIGDDFEANEKAFFEGVELIKKYKIVNSEFRVNNFLNDGHSVLAEGAQGTLLDVDFGSYPFVTSSNTVSAGACTGLGLAPSRLGRIYGIFKAYCTRVGEGPFPTELFCETGQKLRDSGHEYGSTTGRPRRCGWTDLVALKYSVMINGVTDLIMTKADVLSGFETIKVCTSYNTPNGETKEFPHSVEGVTPIYTELKGWSEDISTIKDMNDLPQELTDYISFVEKEIGVTITIVSVGPERDSTMFRAEI